MSTSAHESRKSFRVLLVEIILIIFGVFLGLWANEWRVHKDELADTNQALQYIARELEQNISEINRVIDAHTAIRDSLIALGNNVTFLESTHVAPADFWTAMKRMRVPLLEQTGWQLAVQTGAIRHMDYELAGKISKVYNLQSFYQEKIDKLSDNFYIARNMKTNDVTDMAFAMMMLFRDLVVQEERLIKIYLEIIKQINSQLSVSFQ
ncbi:hypothetical protein JW960_08895 [candidate division KSB1 bacterium]|nr:hypothetical protein [candidate division KSB1 bacterium]